MVYIIDSCSECVCSSVVVSQPPNLAAPCLSLCHRRPAQSDKNHPHRRSQFCYYTSSSTCSGSASNSACSTYGGGGSCSNGCATYPRSNSCANLVASYGGAWGNCTSFTAGVYELLTCAEQGVTAPTVASPVGAITAAPASAGDGAFAVCVLPHIGDAGGASSFLFKVFAGGGTFCTSKLLLGTSTHEPN